MKLDVKRIESKIQFIQDNLRLLNEIATCSEAEFVSDRIKFYAAVHALQISIEAMLDIWTHIIARLHLGVPTNDRETLEIVLANRLTSPEHFQKYIQMNRFRNRVVHGYMDVDPKQVYQMLRLDLDDFRLFFDEVRQIIVREQMKS